MSKRFKNKTCVYCGSEGISRTGDHIFAREFFPLDKRNKLPQVPACITCNNKKAHLEHYLTAVLPFGGRYPDASPMLENRVPLRLAKNAKLHRDLASGQGRVWSKEKGLIYPAMTLPFEGDKLAALFRYIAKGLVAHHWGIQIPSDYFIGAGVLTQVGEQFAQQLLMMNGQARVKESIGDGAFQYEGVQGIDNPNITIWSFIIYGGIKLGGDPQAPEEFPQKVWASTSPQSLEILFGS